MGSTRFLTELRFELGPEFWARDRSQIGLRLGLGSARTRVGARVRVGPARVRVGVGYG